MLSIFKDRDDGIGNFIMPVEQNATQGPDRIAIFYHGYEAGGTFSAEVLDRNTGALLKTSNTFDEEDILHRMDQWAHEYELTGKTVESFDLNIYTQETQANTDDNEQNYRPHYECCLYCEHVGMYKHKEDGRPFLVCSLDDAPVQPTFTCDRVLPPVPEDSKT